MTMSIVSTMAQAGDDIYYTEGFRAVFEDHIEYLRGLVGKGTVIHDISPEDAYQYRYRPYQYLTDKYQVDKQFHWYILRLSRLTGPEDFDASVRKIYVPDWTFVRQLAAAYQTKWTSV